jgi:hypothetical protein
MLLFVALHGLERMVSSVLWTHPFGDVALSQMFEVKEQFIVQFRFHAGAAKYGPEAEVERKEPPLERHLQPSSGQATPSILQWSASITHLGNRYENNSEPLGNQGDRLH